MLETALKYAGKGNAQTLRTLSRVFLMLLVTVHIVTWYALGIHAVGSIGIEALFSGLSRGVINAGFVFWLLHPLPQVHRPVPCRSHCLQLAPQRSIPITQGRCESRAVFSQAEKALGL